jgi:antitoxin ParD1/3/4
MDLSWLGRLLPRFAISNILAAKQVQGRNAFMRKAMSIQIAEDFGTFIDQKVSDGLYSSREEVVEAGLRLLKEQDQELEAIRQALIEGEESGIAEDFDPDSFLGRMRQKYAAKP